MRVIAFNQYGPPEVFREDDLSIPEPGPDEVLVKVHATSVNPLDWKIRTGKSGVRRPGFPQVLGFDVSGVITEAGSEVTDLAVGDEVFGLLNYTKDGANAAYVRTLGSYMRPKPVGLSHTQAATLPLAGLTALQGLKLHGKLKQGERVLIVGAAGGVGSIAVPCAKKFGAHITAVCRAANVDLVKNLGANEVLAHDRDEAPDKARFDLIFDVAKAYDFGTARQFLTRTGRYVGTEPDALGGVNSKLGLLLGKRQKCLTFNTQPDPQALDFLARMVADGELSPIIAKTFPVTDLDVAHAMGEAGGVVGKIAIEVHPHLDG